MKKIKFTLIIMLATAGMPLLHSQKTVFSYAIDTVFVAKDSMTLLSPKGRVLNVGDTVKAWIWYASNDSAQWRQLFGFKKNIALGDSIMLDTFPAYKFYMAYLEPNLKTECIVWGVDNIVYKSLSVPIAGRDRICRPHRDPRHMAVRRL